MCKLVMVDDNQMEHLIMQKMFDRYQLFRGATHFLDGRTALDFLQTNIANTRQLPDIILLDLYMPEYSGWDFLEQFEPLYPLLKHIISIYIVSSSIDPYDITRARQYPFVKDFLSKPVSIATLHALYAAYVDGI
jgi:CheY-like chemotaxis protein